MNNSPTSTPQPFTQPRVHAFVASAGTGKTQQLALRYISLLDQASPDTILAVTFTRNAAGEILERILSLLVDAAQSRSARERLADALHRETPIDVHDIQRWLSVMIDNLHRLRISTLDSFFYEIVSCYPLEFGLSSAPDIADTYKEEQLKLAALREVFAAAKRNQTAFERLRVTVADLSGDDESRRVEEHLTRTIDSGYALFLRAPAEAWDNFPVPHDMSNRPGWKALVAQLRAKSTGTSNFEKFIDRLEDKEWNAVFDKGPTKKVIDSPDGKVYQKWDYSGPEDSALLWNIIEYAETTVITDAKRRTKAFHDFLDRYASIYRGLMDAENLFGYSDICRLLAGQIAPGADAGGLHVYFRLDSAIDHLLIDEFQDTARDQWEALQPIATEAIQDSACRKSFFMVGDVKQAIYGWRGGDARLFGQINAHYSEVLKLDTLTHSFRSGQNILDVVNQVFKDPSLEEWAAATGFAAHTSNVDEPGYVELREIDAGGVKPKVAERKAARCSAVAQLIKRIEPLERGLKTAVLCRGNAMMRLVMATLKASGIDCYVQGKSALFENEAVRCVLSLFAWADMPEDEIAKYHVTSPNSFLRTSVPAGGEEQRDFLQAFRAKLVYDSYAQAIDEIVRPHFPSLNAKSLEYIAQLTDLAATYEKSKTARPADFVTFVQETEVRVPQASEGVVCSTIHGAKGLGYDIVILPELNTLRTRARKPSLYYAETETTNLLDPPRVASILASPGKSVCKVNSDFNEMYEWHQQQSYREFLNLTYVALTRAKRALYMLIDPDEQKGEGGELKSRAQLLARSLRDFEHLQRSQGTRDIPGNSLCAIGEPCWYESAPKTTEQPATAGHAFVQPRISLGHNARRCRAFVAPSSLHESKGRGRAGLFHAASPSGMERGAIFHALFEQIEWLDDALAENIAKETPTLVDRYTRISKGTVPGLNDDVYTTLVSEFMDTLRKPAIRAVLTKPAHECEVLRESNFAAILDDRLVSGTFDRAVLYPNAETPERIEVYDYKTDAVETDEDIAAALENYQPQLGCYRDALAKGYGCAATDVKAFLVFTAPGKIVTTDEEGE